VILTAVLATLIAALCVGVTFACLAHLGARLRLRMRSHSGEKRTLTGDR